jgi:class 3 adenylate cyclase/tetratricopeptide (TPR) repeat protein
VKTCLNCGEENADRANFCQNCAAPLAEKEVSAPVRRIVTIVFADVTGSTSLGDQLDPEPLRHVMERYFDAMEAAIRSHGGIVEKFIGDAVMAVFGIPRLHEDDAIRAVRAADAMRSALAPLNLDLKRDHGITIGMRLGVNTGEVVAGDPTMGQRLVTGDAVNVAARLQQASSAGDVLLGDTTYRLVKDAVEVEPVEPLTVKGKPHPVSAYRLVSIVTDAPGHERRLDSPMVGRENELTLLAGALERAVREQTSHMFTLLGAAGVGKSRLIAEFLANTSALAHGAGSTGPQKAMVLRGRCLSYGEGITFYPLAEIVHKAAGIVDSDPPSAALAKLAAFVADVPGGDRVAPLVGGLFGWHEPGPTEEAFWAVRKMLESLARDRPLIVVFDDIHWAEPTFLDLVEHVANWTRDAAVLLLCIARPELLEIRPDWGGGKVNATSILLEPLPPQDLSLLVNNLLGRAEIPPAARDRILDAAEGNPLFVEEILGMLIDERLLRLEDGTWRPAHDLAEVTVPPTIQLLLAARLDRLDGDERSVIERGAVEGKIFHTGSVITLSPERLRPSVPSCLLALARKELIRPDRAEFAGEDAFRFRHLLIRDAAYQAMPKEQRADLHERFAAWLERAAGERIAEYEEILGHHLEQALQYRAELGPLDERWGTLGLRAASHLIACGERAHERSDPGSARGFFERAANLLDGVDRAAALLRLCNVLEELYDFRPALDAANEALALSESSGDRGMILRARLRIVASSGQVDPEYGIGRAEREATKILDEFETLGDADGRDLSLIVLEAQTFYCGKAMRSFEIAQELAKRASAMPRYQREAVASGIHIAAYFGPIPLDQGFEAVDRAQEIMGDSLMAQVRTATMRAGLLAMAGRFDEAVASINRAKKILQEIGSPTAPFDQVVGEMERLAGRLEAAEREFRARHDAYEASGETGFNSTICALLANTLCDLGRFEEADSFVAKSQALAADDDFASQAGWRSAQARILTSRAQYNDALALADAAVAITEGTDYITWQGDMHEVRGQVLAAAGRIPEARAAFEDAIERFERKGVVPAIERIRRQLAGLREG